jgi:glycine hydroxymethyltransferase
MREIASLIANVIKNYEDQKIKEEVKKKVEELCKKFPIYLEPIPIGNFAGK